MSQSELGPVARLTESKPFGLAMFAASLGLAVKLAAIPDLQAALSTYRSPHAEKAILVVPHLPPYRRCASSPGPALHTKGGACQPLTLLSEAAAAPPGCPTVADFASFISRLAQHTGITQAGP